MAGTPPLTPTTYHPRERGDKPASQSDERSQGYDDRFLLRCRCVEPLDSGVATESDKDRFLLLCRCTAASDLDSGLFLDERRQL
ncbi:hypothetical protein RHGRI_035460 [Rhododendron griersonianum]|uniref:Uncharacterized protein n=1 Tax=Rhododendron griersonianum TaxID=479676 RepID=A0AAV6HJL5_9ERIC|nr:hypothetical protein RHGRI_035460 [Rhododendron griersonianum]